MGNMLDMSIHEYAEVRPLFTPAIFVTTELVHTLRMFDQ